MYSEDCPVAIIAELLGNNMTAEMDAEEFDGSNLADEGLQDHISHWAEVLDRWVRGIDRGLGRQDGAAFDRDQESRSHR